MFPFIPEPIEKDEGTKCGSHSNSEVLRFEFPTESSHSTLIWMFELTRFGRMSPKVEEMDPDELAE